MKIQNPVVVHEMNFLQIASSAVDINSIYLDSADSTFKKKDVNGNVSVLEGQRTVIIPTESIYDEFMTYTPGNVLNTGLWDVVKVVSGVTETDDVSTVSNTLFGTDLNQTQCGRISVVVANAGIASGTITATTKNAILNKDIYTRFFFSSSGTGVGIGNSCSYGLAHKVFVGNDIDGWTTVYDHTLSTAIRSSSPIIESAASSLTIRAVGNNIYDVFCGGKNLNLSKLNGIKIRFSVMGYVSNNDFALGSINNYCYFENIKYGSTVTPSTVVKVPTSYDDFNSVIDTNKWLAATTGASTVYENANSININPAGGQTASVETKIDLQTANYIHLFCKGRTTLGTSSLALAANNGSTYTTLPVTFSEGAGGLVTSMWQYLGVNNHDGSWSFYDVSKRDGAPIYVSIVSKLLFRIISVMGSASTDVGTIYPIIYY